MQDLDRRRVTVEVGAGTQLVQRGERQVLQREQRQQRVALVGRRDGAAGPQPCGIT